MSPGSSLLDITIQLDNARYDIATLLWDMPGGIQGTLEYGRDLFEVSTIERLVERYEAVLRAVVQTPAATVDELVAELRAADASAKQEAAQQLKQSMKCKLQGRRRRSSSSKPRPEQGSAQAPSDRHTAWARAVRVPRDRFPTRSHAVRRVTASSNCACSFVSDAQRARSHSADRPSPGAFSATLRWPAQCRSDSTLESS